MIQPFKTMDEFEELSNMVEKIELEPVFYSIEDIKEYIEPEIEEVLPFAIRLSQQKPETQYEKKARAYLLDLLNKTIIFDDEGDAVE